jgi:hypothetical protein
MADAENTEGSLAMEIMEGRKCQNTKNKYRLKVEHFRKWLLEKHPNCLKEDRTINLSEVNKVYDEHLVMLLPHVERVSERRLSDRF